MKNISKKRYTIFPIFILCISFLFYGCKEANGPELSTPDDGVPNPVKNVKVENIRGGAHIFYTLPDSKNLSYVEAVYETENGGPENVKSSRFKDSLTVAGFANTEPHDVKLFSYSHGGNKSEPVDVTVHPERPSYEYVFDSISLNNAFGGVSVNYGSNALNDTLSIVIVQDSSNQVTMLQQNQVYKTEGAYNLYGLQAKNYRLGYYVRDKYQNRSDTLFEDFTPLFEKEIDKSKFSNAKLPTDSWQNESTQFSDLYNDNASNHGPPSGSSSGPNWVGPQVNSLPTWVTIDLGQKVKISRIVLYGEPHWGQYTNGAPKEFELWGSADPDVNDGEPFDDSWFKYGTFDAKSEQETGIDEETPYPANGVIYQISDAANFPYARYFRIVLDESYSGTKRMIIGEIDLYGGPENLSQ